MNILDFLFPRRCVSCGTFGVYLCRKCLTKIKFIKTPVCPVCERSAIGGATHPGCQTRYSLDGLISACVYEGPVKAVIKRLKYKPWITDLGETLTDLFCQYLSGNSSIIQTIKLKQTITPVPLHPSRERERGFNQAEILGKLLAEKLNLEFVPDLLIRHKKTKTQAELKGEERQENIKNAFKINEKYLQPYSHKFVNPQEIAVKGESRLMRVNLYKFAYKLQGNLNSVLLIDDVWTTGATLRACGQVLKRAGFSKVWALTIAR